MMNSSFIDRKHIDQPKKLYLNQAISNAQRQQSQVFSDLEEGSPTDMKFINSSSSISSLFDSPCPANSISQTTTITPVISRTEFKPLSEFEFSSIITNKLNQHQQEQQQEKLVIILVGLPASGKSTICHQLKSYVNDTTIYRAEVFNAGDVRRRNSTNFNDSDFFNPSNRQGKEARELYATITANNLIDSLTSDIVDVGFLDATNTTVERRQRMIDTIRREANENIKIVIFDIQCNDSRLLNFNVTRKADNNDYKGRDYKSAIADFKKRAQHYYKVYQPITKDELDDLHIDMYMKIVNAGETFDFSHVDNKFKQDCHWFKILQDFKDTYYEREGKRYLDLVEKWYSN